MKVPGKEITTAIILAGGFGTRLQSILPDRPKVLAEIAGRPFLYYLLQYLVRQKIQQIILSLGYLASQVVNFIGDGSSWDASIRVVIEETPLGTAGALRLATESFSEPFFALNGDTLFLVDLGILQKAHQAANSLATMALAYVNEGASSGCVLLKSEANLPGVSGTIHQFIEKPPGSGPSLVNGGIYILEPAVLSCLVPGQKASLEREIFPSLANKKEMIGQVQDAYFIDIGTPQSLAKFEQDLTHGKIPGYERI